MLYRDAQAIVVRNGHLERKGEGDFLQGKKCVRDNGE